VPAPDPAIPRPDRCPRCGLALSLDRLEAFESNIPTGRAKITDEELACANGHRFGVILIDGRVELGLVDPSNE
jgi:hypothetical protein